MYTVDVEAGMPELHNRKYSPGGNFVFNLRSFHINLSNFLHYALHSLSYSRVQPVAHHWTACIANQDLLIVQERHLHFKKEKIRYKCKAIQNNVIQYNIILDENLTN
jgi:hypothetical protein